MSKTAVIAVSILSAVLCSISSLSSFMVAGSSGNIMPTPTPTSSPSTTLAPLSVLPKGRYVKLIHTVAYDANASGNVDDKNKIINLAELEVFDKDDTNLAANKTVTGSSQYSSIHGYVNLTDGNKTNFAHTKGRTEDEIDYLQVDLDSSKEIKKLLITNRTSCCKKRAIGIKAVILGADGTTIIKETPSISTIADTYTLIFPENVWR
jgi:hypothetical protein